jgi:hypothetical protein
MNVSGVSRTSKRFNIFNSHTRIVDIVFVADDLCEGSPSESPLKPIAPR